MIQGNRETQNDAAKIRLDLNNQQDKHMIQFAFMTTKGNLNRVRLISILKNEPLNAHQLTKRLEINYKAVQHHINFLERNKLVSKIGTKYGAVYFPSTLLKENMTVFNEISKTVLKK